MKWLWCHGCHLYSVTSNWKSDSFSRCTFSWWTIVPNFITVWLDNYDGALGFFEEVTPKTRRTWTRMKGLYYRLPFLPFVLHTHTLGFWIRNWSCIATDHEQGIIISLMNKDVYNGHFADCFCEDCWNVQVACITLMLMVSITMLLGGPSV